MTIEITDQCIQLGITIISKMMDQWIQLGIAVILVVTLSLIFRQVRMQRQLLDAQLLSDRFEMYVKANEPVRDEKVKELKLYPDDFMDIRLYEKKYKDKDEAIHKYLYMAELYEYLAFTHAMPMPEKPFLAPDFLKMWVTDLCQESEFEEVHEYYREYYPPFAEVVRKLLKAKELDQD